MYINIGSSYTIPKQSTCEANPFAKNASLIIRIMSFFNEDYILSSSGFHQMCAIGKEWKKWTEVLFHFYKWISSDCSSHHNGKKKIKATDFQKTGKFTGRVSSFPVAMFDLLLDPLSLQNASHPGLCHIKFLHLPFTLTCYKNLLDRANDLEMWKKKKMGMIHKKQMPYEDTYIHEQMKSLKQNSLTKYDENDTINDASIGSIGSIDSIDSGNEFKGNNGNSFHCPSSFSELKHIFFKQNNQRLGTDSLNADSDGDVTPVSPSNSMLSTPFQSYSTLASYPEDKKNQKNHPFIMILLIHGGDFAAGIFNPLDGKCIKHSTVHKYVTRRKQGKRQGNNDKQKQKGAQSAGAMIRRHNEEHFKIKTRQILKSWEEDGYIAKCDIIFLYCPGPHNKQLLFENEKGYCSIFSEQDRRVKVIPFSTGPKPNYSQVRGAYKKLLTMTLRRVATTSKNFSSFSEESDNDDNDYHDESDDSVKSDDENTKDGNDSENDNQSISENSSGESSDKEYSDED